jgi:AcrR family transcriptional regulator
MWRMARLRRVEQVERNRELLLAAARRVFLQRGYSGASLEAVAEEAGFSKGVVYSQFGSKADLFLALLEVRISERAAQNRRVTAGLAGAEGVRALLRTGSRDARAEPGWAALLVEFRAVAGRDQQLNGRYARAHERTVNELASVLGRLHERAGLEPLRPLRSMAELILAVGTGVALERAANPAALPDEELLEWLPRALGLGEASHARPVKATSGAAIALARETDEHID